MANDALRVDDLAATFRHDFPIVVKCGAHAFTQDAGHRLCGVLGGAVLANHAWRRDPLPELIPLHRVVLGLELVHRWRVFAVVPPLAGQPARGSFRAAAAFGVTPVTYSGSQRGPALAGALAPSHSANGTARKGRQRREKRRHWARTAGGSLSPEWAASGRGVTGAAVREET